MFQINFDVKSNQIIQNDLIYINVQFNKTVHVQKIMSKLGL